MTAKKFYLTLLLQAAVLFCLKFVYFSSVNYGGLGWEFLYCAIVAVATTFLVRGIGVMNYLEAIFAAILWLILDLLVDALVTGPLVGYAMFATVGLWAGYGTMMVFVFIMNKKRHIAVRHGEWQDKKVR